MTGRERIEQAFEYWAEKMVRHRVWALVCMLGLAAVLVQALPGLRLDNSFQSFLHEDDPAKVVYDKFRQQFGRDDPVFIAIETSRIFDFAFLTRLRNFHHALEREVPNLEKVTSLINARNTYGDDDVLIVEDLMKEWPRNEADLRTLRERVYDNPLYVDMLVSEDGHFTTVTVQPSNYSQHQTGDALEGFEDTDPNTPPAHLSERELMKVVDAAETVAARFQAPDFRIYVAGGVVVANHLNERMQMDIEIFLAASLGLILLVLYVVFRRVSGMILPLLVVVLSMVSTLGVMAMLDIPLSLTTGIMPSFLLTVGVCDSVHILAIFYQGLSEGLERREAIVRALGHSGLAVLMTSLTTAGGLVSFSVARVAPVSQLGIIAPIGVMLAFLFTIVFLPAALASVPFAATSGVKRRGSSWLQSGLVGIGNVSIRRPGTVLGVSVLVLVIAGFGVRQVRFSQNELLWFPEKEPLRQAMEVMDRNFKGAVTVEVIVGTSRENGLQEPGFLQGLEAARKQIGRVRYAHLVAGKMISLADVLKETNQALHENRAKFYVLPTSHELIAQEFLLFENSGSDDLEELVNSQFSVGRVSLRVPWADSMLYPRFLKKVHEVFREKLGNDVKIDVTGISALFGRMASNLIWTLGVSYGIALLIITPLMILLLGNFRRGILSMLPNLAPIWIILGLMGVWGIGLDMATLLIGGIIIGLAVDDTIHFMHGFNRVYRATGDPSRAVHETLQTTGLAMLFTSIVLCAGFLIFGFAYMKNISTFGFLAALATAIAFLADITLSPALMILVTRSAFLRSNRAGVFRTAQSSRGSSDLPVRGPSLPRE